MHLEAAVLTTICSPACFLVLWLVSVHCTKQEVHERGGMTVLLFALELASRHSKVLMSFLI